MEVTDDTQTGRVKNINADLYSYMTPHTALVTPALPLPGLGCSPQRGSRLTFMDSQIWILARLIKSSVQQNF